jgi:hypothetical protein
VLKINPAPPILKTQAMKKQQAKEESIQGLNIFRKFTNFLLWIVFIMGYLMVGFFGIKLFLIFLTLPVLTIYGAAYNLYTETGNVELFKNAAIFAKNYLQSWIFLILGALMIFFRKTIKNKMDENE